MQGIGVIVREVSVDTWRRLEATRRRESNDTASRSWDRSQRAELQLLWYRVGATVVILPLKSKGEPAVVLTLPLKIHWLLHDRDRALRTHVMLGDDIGIAQPNGQVRWLIAAANVPKRDLGALMLRYEGDGESVGFCLPALADAAVQIERARKAAKPAVAARKWGPLLGKFSYLVDEATPAAEHVTLDDETFAAARRAAHPDPLIDRFLMRDRAWHAAALERSFTRRDDAVQKSLGRAR